MSLVHLNKHFFALIALGKNMMFPYPHSLSCVLKFNRNQIIRWLVFISNKISLSYLHKTTTKKQKTTNQKSTKTPKKPTTTTRKRPQSVSPKNPGPQKNKTTKKPKIPSKPNSKKGVNKENKVANR